MCIGDWMLDPGERGNPDTMIDRRRGDDSTWTAGNDVTPLVHGKTYFDVLLEVLAATTAGDLVMLNRRLGAEIEEAGGECLLDMRVRPGGSHHQKLVLVRHRNRPELDVAFVGSTSKI